MGAELGKRAVMREAIKAAGGAVIEQRAAERGEQLTMLPVPGDRPGRAARLRNQAARTNRAGRPPGATNQEVKALREYLLARGVHPLQRMMEWSMHTPTSLAAELGCSRLAAFDRLRELWRDAAPFFAPKLVPTDDQGREVPTFELIIGGQHLHAHAAGPAAPWIYDGGPVVEESEQNQALPSSEPDVSQDNVSHEDDK